MENRKIIGYISPMDLYDGVIKKGDVFVIFEGSPNKYVCNHKFLPKEIVETWEPVYENKFPMQFKELKVLSAGWFIGEFSGIKAVVPVLADCRNENVFVTKALANAALAIAQLSQLHKAWLEIEPLDFKRLEHSYHIYVNKYGAIFTIKGSYSQNNRGSSVLYFRTVETAELFIETFRDLLEIAKPLLK